PIYVHGLREIVTNSAAGLREMIGNLVFALFLFQVLSSLWIRDESSMHSLALGGGALAHYLIPTALLRGDEPTHYLYVAISFFVVVAAAGAVRVVRWCETLLATLSPQSPSRLAEARAFILILVLAPILCLTGVYYVGALR